MPTGSRCTSLRSRGRWPPAISTSWGSWTKTFVPGPGIGEWKEARYRPEWRSYQDRYDHDYGVDLPPGTRVVELSRRVRDPRFWQSGRQVRGLSRPRARSRDADGSSGVCEVSAASALVVTSGERSLLTSGRRG